MAKRWLYALVTYSGGHAMTTQGIRFQFNKPKRVEDMEKACSFDGKPNFHVANYYEDIILKISDIDVEELPKVKPVPVVVEEVVEEVKEEVVKSVPLKEKVLKKKKKTSKKDR